MIGNILFLKIFSMTEVNSFLNKNNANAFSLLVPSKYIFTREWVLLEGMIFHPMDLM